MLQETTIPYLKKKANIQGRRRRDPKFLAQAKKSKLIINYGSEEEIERLVDQILAISPKAKERLQFLRRPKGERQGRSGWLESNACLRRPPQVVPWRGD